MAAGERGLVEYGLPCGWWPVVMWGLAPGERVSKAIEAAALEYAAKCGMEAQFAFIRSLPAGTPEGEFAPEIGNVMLIEAAWVPAGVVALARGGTQRIDEKFKSWSRVSVSGAAHEETCAPPTGDAR